PRSNGSSPPRTSSFSTARATANGRSPSSATTPLTTHRPARDHHAADADTPQVVPSPWRTGGPIPLANDTTHQVGLCPRGCASRDCRINGVSVPWPSGARGDENVDGNVNPDWPHPAHVIWPHLGIPPFRGGITYEEMPCPRREGSSIRSSARARCGSFVRPASPSPPSPASWGSTRARWATG